MVMIFVTQFGIWEKLFHDIHNLHEKFVVGVNKDGDAIAHLHTSEDFLARFASCHADLPETLTSLNIQKY